MLPYTTYLIDLDGVVYRGNELLPGAKEFVAWLNANSKKYLFLTNNSFASEAQVLEKLVSLSIVTDEGHVLGAAQAAVKNIARRFPHSVVYLIGEQPLHNMLLEHQLQVVDEDTHKPAVVLVGLDRHFDYQKLTRAVHAVRAGASFIAINRDPLLPVAGDLLPGTGTMVAAIEAGSGVTPEVIGKPQPTLFQEAMRMLGSQPGETVMIGDVLTVDIKGAKAAGIHTILVLSGKESPTDVAASPIKPDYIYDNIAAVLAELEGKSR